MKKIYQPEGNVAEVRLRVAVRRRVRHAHRLHCADSQLMRRARQRAVRAPSTSQDHDAAAGTSDGHRTRLLLYLSPEIEKPAHPIFIVDLILHRIYSESMCIDCG